jgi:hypothetical protein
VKIAVGGESVNENVEMTDESTYDNPYLLDSKGPKRMIDYTKPDGYENDDDYVLYDSAD